MEVKEGIKTGGSTGTADLNHFTDKLGIGSALKSAPSQQTQPAESVGNGPQNSGGLAASSLGLAQPTTTLGAQNPTINSSMTGGLAGSGYGNIFQNNQGMQNQYGIIGGAILI